MIGRPLAVGEDWNMYLDQENGKLTSYSSYWGYDDMEEYNLKYASAAELQKLQAAALNHANYYAKLAETLASMEPGTKSICHKTWRERHEVDGDLTQNKDGRWQCAECIAKSNSDKE